MGIEIDLANFCMKALFQFFLKYLGLEKKST